MSRFVAVAPALSLALLLVAPAAQATKPDDGKIALITPLPATPPRPILIDSFCQVDGVDRAPYGVAVYFNAPAKVTVRTPDGTEATRRYDPAALPGTEWADSEGPVLYLGLGASFTIPDGEGGQCRGTVVRNKQRLMVVQMTADYTVGSEEDSDEAVIYAQPTGATVREGRARGYDFHASWPAAVQGVPALRREYADRARKDERELVKLARKLRSIRDRADDVLVTHFDATRTAGDTGRLLSLLSEVQSYTGGAHGAYGWRARIWDRTSRQLIKDATPLFADGLAGLHPSWCKALDAQRVVRSNGQYQPGKGKYLGDWDCPPFEQLSVVAIGAPGQPFDRLRIIAEPYVAGPWSDGSYEATFPITPAVLAQVKPAYRADFAVYKAPGK